MHPLIILFHKIQLISQSKDDISLLNNTSSFQNQLGFKSRTLNPGWCSQWMLKVQVHFLNKTRKCTKPWTQAMRCKIKQSTGVKWVMKMSKATTKTSRLFYAGVNKIGGCMSHVFVSIMQVIQAPQTSTKGYALYKWSTFLGLLINICTSGLLNTMLDELPIALFEQLE